MDARPFQWYFDRAFEKEVVTLMDADIPGEILLELPQGRCFDEDVITTAAQKYMADWPLDNTLEALTVPLDMWDDLELELRAYLIEALADAVQARLGYEEI